MWWSERWLCVTLALGLAALSFSGVYDLGPRDPFVLSTALTALTALALAAASAGGGGDELPPVAARLGFAAAALAVCACFVRRKDGPFAANLVFSVLVWASVAAVLTSLPALVTGALHLLA
jgi:hypothetical protein